MDVIDAALRTAARWSTGEGIHQIQFQQLRGALYAVQRSAERGGVRELADMTAGIVAALNWDEFDPFVISGALRTILDAAHYLDTRRPIADVELFDASTQIDLGKIIGSSRRSLSPRGADISEFLAGPLWASEEPFWFRQGWAKLKAYRDQKVEWPAPELFERELENLGPLSGDLRASLADSRWIDDEVDAGRLREYEGKHVAVVGRQVVGTGESQLKLVCDTASRLGIAPCRVAVRYIG